LSPPRSGSASRCGRASRALGSGPTGQSGFRSNAYNENTTVARDAAYHPSYFDIPLKSFLYADDASPMSGIRVEMCFNTPWTGAPTTTPYVHFLRYNLSIIPLFGAL